MLRCMIFLLIIFGATIKCYAKPLTAENLITLYMAPNGDDGQTGLTLSRPIRTFDRAQTVIKRITSGNPRDVLVRIAPGLYRDQQTVWTHTMPNNTIIFRSEGAEAPVFSGEREGGVWFTLKSEAGLATNLAFVGLEVRNYPVAIQFLGNPDIARQSNSRNRIENMRFIRIGENPLSSSEKYNSAIRLVNSHDNIIQGNIFSGIGRRQQCQSFNSIEIAHHSHHNIIKNNVFQFSCADPVKIRNQSNDNIMINNHFNQSGMDAIYTEWYCGSDGKIGNCHEVQQHECPSFRNQFRNNTAKSSASQQKKGFFLIWGSDYITGCPYVPPNQQRIAPSGNIFIN